MQRFLQRQCFALKGRCQILLNILLECSNLRLAGFFLLQQQCMLGGRLFHHRLGMVMQFLLDVDLKIGRCTGKNCQTFPRPLRLCGQCVGDLFFKTEAAQIHAGKTRV